MPLELRLRVCHARLMDHGDIEPSLLPIWGDDLDIDLEAMALGGIFHQPLSLIKRPLPLFPGSIHGALQGVLNLVEVGVRGFCVARREALCYILPRESPSEDEVRVRVVLSCQASLARHSCTKASVALMANITRVRGAGRNTRITVIGVHVNGLQRGVSKWARLHGSARPCSSW